MKKEQRTLKKRKGVEVFRHRITVKREKRPATLLLLCLIYDNDNTAHKEISTKVVLDVCHTLKNTILGHTVYNFGLLVIIACIWKCLLYSP